jgi:hypothetical protein
MAASDPVGLSFSMNFAKDEGNPGKAGIQVGVEYLENFHK